MILRTIATSVIALGLLTCLVAACASGQPDAASACVSASAQAMAIDPASDTVQVADGGIAGCPSLEAWVAAAQMQHVHRARCHPGMRPDPWQLMRPESSAGRQEPQPEA
jgi:hypothetical protein